MVDGIKICKFGGNGLGLVIVCKLMEMMNGNIEFYSEGIDWGIIIYIIMLIKERLLFENK